MSKAKNSAEANSGAWSRRTTKWGSIGTAVWVALAVYYVFGYVCWSTFVALPANSMGDFFAGFFAPLAFLWLVLGYLQQGNELRFQSDQIRAQRTAIEANELHARRDTFMRFVEQVMLEQYELAASLMPAASQRGHGVEMAWGRFSQGGRNQFFSAIIENGFRKVPAATTNKIRRDEPERSRALRFVENCEIIFKQCDSCDDENELIRSYFENSKMASAYAGLCIILERPIAFRLREKPAKIDDIH